MLSQQENELITRSGPGTPMGEVLRRYWMPILLEREVAEPDGEPVKVQILGERLVAFRDTNGRLGLLDEFCPHRRVSLWLGRNEEKAEIGAPRSFIRLVVPKTRDHNRDERTCWHREDRPIDPRMSIQPAK